MFFGRGSECVGKNEGSNGEVRDGEGRKNVCADKQGKGIKM